MCDSFPARDQSTKCGNTLSLEKRHDLPFCFESLNGPTHNVVCICQPIQHKVNKEGIIPYQLVGLRAMQEECGPVSELNMATHIKRQEREKRPAQQKFTIPLGRPCSTVYEPVY